MTNAGGNKTGATLSLVINIINHGIIFLITGYIIYLSGFNTRLDFHVVFCTIGYVFLMSESFMVLTPENIWSRPITNYRNRTHIHWVLQILGAAFTIAGVLLKFMDKKRHFTTIHGILGIISVAIMCFLCLSGISLFYTVKFKQLFRPVVFKFIHSFLGIACFIVGIACQCFGYDKKWMKKAAGQEIAIIAMIVTAISALICLLRPFKSMISHGRAAFRL